MRTCGPLETAHSEKLELSNMCLRRGGQNVQPYTGRSYGLEAIDAFVSDCTAARYLYPLPFPQYFDRVLLDVLTFDQPLHDQSVIEGNRFLESHFENRVAGALRCRPERVETPVKCTL